MSAIGSTLLEMGLDMSKGLCLMIWLVLILVFIIIEVCSLGLVSIWFAAGAFVALIVAIMGGGPVLQMSAFILSSGVLMACTRKIARKHLDNRIVKTNSDSMVGNAFLVIEEIDNQKDTGKIRIGDVEWTARAVEDTQIYEIGEQVVVKEIKGVKCMVTASLHE